MGCVLCNMAKSVEHYKESMALGGFYAEHAEWKFDLNEKDIQECLAYDIVNKHPKIAGYVLKYMLLNLIPHFISKRISYSWYQWFHERVWR